MRKSTTRPHVTRTPPRRRVTHRAEEARIATRRVQALDLRKAGATYRRIAEALSVDVSTAYADVQAELTALRTLAAEQAEEVREIELRRLDDYTLGLTPKARKGDADAVRTLIRVSERRAKLLGLDAPQSGGDLTPVTRVEVVIVDPRVLTP